MMKGTQIVQTIAIIMMGLWAITALPYTGAAEYDWQKSHVNVLPKGDMEWAPHEFQFEAGKTVRYIDYENGNDNNAGTKASPWKHHPWDEAAIGNAAKASGPATYVFKGGVIYRGKMLGSESGTAQDPIRFTSDPSWGQGLAKIYGSKKVTGNWKRANAQTAPRIPEPEKVWYVDLPDDFDQDPADVQLSSLWLVNGDEAVRMHLARDPNYKVTNPSYPLEHWYNWDAFEGTGSGGVLIDKKWEGKPKDFFDGGIIWSQHRGLMGTPHSLAIQEYDSKKGGFKISSPGGVSWRWPREGRGRFNYTRKIHYYIEKVPDFLDAPYEYYHAASGPNKGRLYVRLPEGMEPQSVTLEAGVVMSPIEIRDASHIEVSGLHFSFNDEDDGEYGYPWHIGAGPMVRVIGNCEDITIRNNRFYDVISSAIAFPRPSGGDQGAARAFQLVIGNFADDFMTDIFITDNDIRNNSAHTAIKVVGNSQRGGERWEDAGYGVLKHAKIMRNRVVNSGFRPGKSPTTSIPAISLVLPETGEVAGNFVDGSWGNGIFAMGGKSSGAINEVPLVRLFFHHNKLENLMLGCNDYGGLEIFQGGPAYFYNNIVHNTVGTKTFTGTELGYALYFDGGFKLYAFNNILTGRFDPDNPGYYSHGSFWTVFGYLNNFWNNTVYRFDFGVGGSSGNRSAVIGNIMMDMKKAFIAQNRPGDVSMLGGGDTGEQGRRGISTMSYGHNVFHGDPGKFGDVAGTSQGSRHNKAQTLTGATLEELKTLLEDMGARVSTLGVHTDVPPLMNPKEGDFRPNDASPAKDMGVKFFVPWSLSRVVGEWGFQPSAADPGVVSGENFYMQEEYIHRSMYYFVPRNDLTISSADNKAYVEGPLEDWTKGALQFDGKSRFAKLTHSDMTTDFEYNIGRGSNPETMKGAGRRTLDMSDNNFLLEIVAQVAEGHSNGTLVSKSNGRTGYTLSIDDSGRLKMDLHAAGQTSSLVGPKINDGKWRHIIAEIDRGNGRMVLYLDGKQAADSEISLPKMASLGNTADFLVGKDHDGDYFFGAVDFLRVSRGTLADAQTTIEELYEWQFNGPFLRDFSGREPKGQRDAGAIESLQ